MLTNTARARKRMAAATSRGAASDPAPLLVHFIYGLSDTPSERAFSFAHYSSIRSAFLHLQPAKLLLHHHHEPATANAAAYWQRAVALAEPRRVALPTSIFGRPLAHAAHRADVLRLQLLIAHGGLYLDLDVVVLRPMAHLLRGRKSFVIGREGHVAHGGVHGLCNAVLLSRPNASFARRWLDEYRDFGVARKGTDPWSEHSIQRPVSLAKRHPDEVRILPFSAFFWPDWDEAELRKLLLLRTDPLAHLASDGGVGSAAALQVDGEKEWSADEEPPTPSPAYAVHLWGSRGRKFILDHWSPEYLLSVPSSLNCILRAKLSPLNDPLPPPLPAGVERSCGCGDGGNGASAGGSIIAHWPLRRDAGLASASSPRLLIDASGHCQHGWIYSECSATTTNAASRPTQPVWSAYGKDDFVERRHFRISAPMTASSGGGGDRGGGGAESSGCWAEPLRSGDGGVAAIGSAPTLSISSELEAFAPLPPSSLTRSNGAFTISWWASVHSRRDGCGGSVPFWSLRFADGSTLSALAESRGGSSRRSRHLVPTVRWVGKRRRGLYALAAAIGGYGDVEVVANGASACSNGWHHYSLIARGNNKALALFIDGEKWAEAGGGDGSSSSSSSSSAPSVEGMWIGGGVVEPIAYHAPSAHAGPGDASHAVGLASLGLLEGAILPQQLPRVLRHPETAGSDVAAYDQSNTVRVRHEAPWMVELVRMVASSARDGSGGATEECTACDGRLEPPSESLFRLPAWATGRSAPKKKASAVAAPHKVATRAYLFLIAIGLMLLILLLRVVRTKRRSGGVLPGPSASSRPSPGSGKRR